LSEEQPVNNAAATKKHSEKHIINFNFFILSIPVFCFQFFYIFLNNIFVSLV